MTKQIALTLLILFGCSAIFAQYENPLSLQECMEIALQNNSNLRIAELQVEYAGANVTSAWSSVLPTINTSFQSGKYIQGARKVTTDVPLGRDPETGQVVYEQRTIVQDRVERNSHSAQISLNQNLYDFGRSTNTIKGAKSAKQSYEYTLQNIRLIVIQNVKAAFYNLLKEIRLEQVYQQAVTLAQEQLDESQTRLEIGLVSQAEVFQSKVNLGKYRTQLITQQNLVEMARADLNTALGRDPGIPVDVVEDVTEPIFPDYSFQEALDNAMANNQNIKSLELDVKTAYYDLKAAQARYMPTIGGSVRYARQNDDINRVYTAELDMDYSVTVGVGLDLNIFNGFADKAAVQRNTLTYRMQQEDLVEARRLLASSVKDYLLQLDAYEDFLEINKENIQAAKENLRLQQERRRVGAGTELEVTQAQVDMTRAQADYVRAEYDAKIARARLEAVMGIEAN
jgi:outer membrane protein